MENWISDVKQLLSDRTFFLLIFSSFMCITGVTMLSPALPMIAEGLSVTNSEIGLLVTAFTLPAIFILPFSGYLADNFGRNNVMAVGSLLIGVGGLLSFFTNDFSHLVVFRVLQGVGQAGVMPLTVALIGDLYNGAKQTQAQGLRGTSNKVGSMLWPIIGGVLAGIGWNNIFLVYTLFIPLGVVSYFKIPSKNGEAENPFKYMKGMKSVVERPRVATYLFLGFVRMFVKFSIITYIPILLASRYSVSAGIIGGYMALRGAGGFISSSSAGLFDKKYGKVKPIAVAFLTIGVSSLLVALTETPVVVVGMLLAYGFMDSLFSALHKSMLNESVGEDYRTGLMTTNSLAQNIGSTAAPLAIGAILFLGEEIWLYIIATMLFIAVTIFLLVEKFNR